MHAREIVSKPCNLRTSSKLHPEMAKRDMPACARVEDWARPHQASESWCCPRQCPTTAVAYRHIGVAVMHEIWREGGNKLCSEKGCILGRRVEQGRLEKLSC